MNAKIKAHLEKYATSKGWPTNLDSLIEIAQDYGKQVYREEVSRHRWWNEYLYVREIDGMLISHINAEANRDESVHDLGYEFDPDTICEVKPVEKTITVYEPVE